ncbi:hypothetical protein JW796_03340 [Candidatus Dojkabacteria bacterium]|nr:hypothetical protein [Candidatus Dojkabacteria bacterium]
MSETAIQEIQPSRFAINKADLSMDSIRAQYSNRYSNSINYVLQALKAIQSAGGEEREALLNIALTESLTDIYTQIVEHPIAETTAIYEYSLPWDKSNLPWKLATGNRTLDEIYREAINNASGQIPEFEILRNTINLSNYEKLRRARQMGDKRNFVEFSPSPPLTEEAKKRGYLGNDTIFLFINENGTEKVIQKWLPATSTLDYEELLNELAINTDSNNLSDLSIMASSGFFDDNKLRIITDFIEQRTKGLEEMKIRLIEAYAKTFVWERVREEFRTLITATAAKLNKGENISKELSFINETMAVLQFGFRKYIHDVMKLETGINYDQDGGFSDFQKMDRYAQARLMRQEGYVMSACGISEKFSTFGRVNSILNPGFEPQPTPDRPDPVRCDICGKVLKYVKNGDPSTYDRNLKCCGKSYSCTET